MSVFKNNNEEIEYLSKMIFATREEDTNRLHSIGSRLIELSGINDNLDKINSEPDALILKIAKKLKRRMQAI